MNTPFCTQAEINAIKSDINHLFQSKEANTVTITYGFVASAVLDKTFGGESGTPTIITLPNVKCIQQIISNYDERLLSFGIVAVGDAVFYFPASQQLNLGIKGSLRIIDANGSVWFPIPYDQKFYSYLQTILGSVSLFNAIAARIQQ